MKWNAPEPIPITCVSNLSRLVGSGERKEKLTVWWGKMCSSTADQAARCFEASISVVTTKIGGISSGAAHPDPASDSQ